MKNFFLKKESFKGFSLIEMLVYVTLLSLLMVLVVQMGVAVSRSYKSIKISKNIENSAVTTFETLTREIRNASSVDTLQSIIGTSPGKLVLNGAVGSTTEFFLESGILKLKEGGVVAGPLSIASSTITNLVYSLITTPISQGVKIEMTIESSIGTVTKQEKFYVTTMLRASY